MMAQLKQQGQWMVYLLPFCCPWLRAHHLSLHHSRCTWRAGMFQHACMRPACIIIKLPTVPVSTQTHVTCAVQLLPWLLLPTQQAGRSAHLRKLSAGLACSSCGGSRSWRGSSRSTSHWPRGSSEATPDWLSEACSRQAGRAAQRHSQLG